MCLSFSVPLDTFGQTIISGGRFRQAILKCVKHEISRSKYCYDKHGGDGCTSISMMAHNQQYPLSLHNIRVSLP